MSLSSWSRRTIPRTSWTGWLEPMTEPLPLVEIAFREGLSTSHADRLPLLLLADLESSLRASQRALLARDLALLERLTDEQFHLQQRLALLPVTRSGSCLDESPATAVDTSMNSAVIAAHRRLLHLGRVHGALLDRAQQRLRTLARFLADPQAPYGPAPGGAGIEPLPDPSPRKEP